MATIPKEILEEIRRIEIQSIHLAEDLLAGAYRSIFRGTGMEFEEVRDYVPGDDIRSIDWNVTARLNHPYVKVFREERELPIIVTQDISTSMLGGSGKSTKQKVAATLTALLSFSALRSNDKVGLLLFSDKVEGYLSPKKGFRHVLRVIRDVLISSSKESKTDMLSAIKFLISTQKKAAIIFIISDFLAPLRGKELAALSKRADVVGLCLVDPWEVQVPPLGLTLIKDPETGITDYVDLASPEYPLPYSEALQKNRDEWKQCFLKAGAQFLTVKTDESPVNALRKFFGYRKVRS
ncbi:DUF58 domain-containing protein [Estrella lausannensis]|uniref:DUF58 domain-containing protein n=1 Tax=Estrella lausannensis TaxID=483423 RepID=A0A0H5DMZ6_9BACT|nr:DUF58 domain-containing protein [Estrella lausannensis]CRX37397.1 Conserved hypothetical protein [Estrella lausannensis]